MSIKSALKAKFGNTYLWETASECRYALTSAKSAAYVLGAFLLGWCSYGKLKAFLRERNRRHKIMKAAAKGKDIAPTEYNGKRILTLEEANELIGNAIERGEPFMAARYGSVELEAVWIVRDDGKGFIRPASRPLHMLHYSAGFFPKDKKLCIKFAELMKWATSQVDFMGVWWNPMEEYMLGTYGSNVEYCRLHCLDPFTAPNPWSAKLEGKKVVVIHPFADTIRSQYAKRELLFPDRNVLPAFDLRIIRAVQTITGNKDDRFATWFEALDYMYNETMSQDFDVAIIGCGAYGYPLAAKLKAAGKIAIHLGGVTQLLFGIRGKRWEVEYKGAYPEMMKNPAWVRPSEKPERFETHEGGAYW